MDVSTTRQPVLPIFPVLLVNFIGMLGYSIVMPFLVFLVRDFGGNEFMYGILGAIYPACQLIGAPLLGRWSDQVGRRRILMISQAGTFLAWLLFLLAINLPVRELLRFSLGPASTVVLTAPLTLLFLARALDGITGGNVSVANAYLSDVSDNSNRKANFGKMASSTSLGFILGPALAAFLGATVLEETLPVLAAALISMLAIVVIYSYLPESRPELVANNLPAFRLNKLFSIEQKECYQREHCPDTGFREVVKMPYVAFCFGIYFLTFLGFSFFYAGFPLYASNQLGWDTTKLGLFFTLSSVVMVVVQGPILNFLSARVKDSALVSIGSLFLASNFFLLVQGSDLWAYIAVVVMAIGNGLMWPSFLSILSRLGSRSVKGTIQGYANSIGSAASIFGLVLGGFLMARIGEFTFVLSGSFILLIFLISFRLPAIERKLDEQSKSD